MKLTENVSRTIHVTADTSVRTPGYEWTLYFSEYGNDGRDELTVRMSEEQFRKLTEMMVERCAPKDDSDD